MDNINDELISERIKPYKVSDFNSDQMYEIRIGLKKGLDVSKYADPKFIYCQMAEIREGLEKGLDVSAYADPKFSFYQMFEIRKGLEQRLDVTKYADPKYNEYQMYKIRKNLENTVNQNNDEELDESKKIVESNNEIQKVTPEKLSEIIENMKDDKYYGRFYAKEGDMFVAVDNTTANAWTEEFNTEKDALLWLENTDMTREELVDMRKINNNDEEEDER